MRRVSHARSSSGLLLNDELHTKADAPRAGHQPPVRDAKAADGAPLRAERFDAARMGLGLPAIAPSELPRRRELRERNIRAYWFRQPTEQIRIEETQDALLLWMRFPDMRFMKTNRCRFIRHCRTFQQLSIS